jgi:hypothetical protein
MWVGVKPMFDVAKPIALTLMMMMILMPIPSSVGQGNDGPEGRILISSYPAQVHFNVTYPNGTPAADVTVYILSHYSSSGFGDTGRTNASGQVMMTVDSNNWGPSMVLLYDGGQDHFLRLDMNIWPKDRTYLDLMLPEHLPYVNVIKGTVRKLDTGEPAPGVGLHLSGRDSMDRPVDEVVIADGSGRYTFLAPNSTSGYGLTVTDPLPGYDQAAIFFNVNPSLAENVYDLYIRPEMVSTVPLSYRVVDATTSVVMDGDTSYVRGSPIGRDLSGVYRGMTEDPVTQTFSGDLMEGCYEVGWTSEKDGRWNITYSIQTYVLLNETPLDMDIPIEVPTELRPVTLRTWKGTGGPLGYTLVDYSYSVYEGSQRTGVRLDGQATPDGWLFFGVPPDRDIQVRAWYWGYEEETFVIPAGPASSPVDLNITFEEGGSIMNPQGDFSILVRDEITHVPIPNAYVSGYTWDDEGSYYSIGEYTSGNGYANGSADAMKYPEVFIYHALGTAVLKNVTIVVGERTDLVVDLERRTFPDPYYKYTLDLRDPQGQPVPTTLMELNSYDMGYYFTATSDSTGTLTFYAQPSTYSMRLKGDDYFWYMSPHWNGEGEFDLEPGGGHLGTITLYPTRPLQIIEGHVLDASTMEPLRFRRVSTESIAPIEAPSRQIGPFYPWMDPVFNRPETGAHLLWYETFSDRTGFYRTYGRDTVELTLWEEGYFPYYEVMDIDSATSKDILLDPIPEATTTLEGTLVDEDGDPVEGVVLLFEDDHQAEIFLDNYTGEDGKFAFDLHPAEYRVLFGNMTLHGETTVVVNESGLTGLILELIPRSYLNGTVKDAEGVPVSGINISVLSPGTGEGTVIDSMLSNSTGGFSFLLGKGSYRLEFAGNDTYQRAESAEILLTGWIDVSYDLVLFERTSGTIMGHVRGNGGPLVGGMEGATVWLNDASGTPILFVETGPLGVFEFEDVPKGSGYLMNATPPVEEMGEVGVATGYLPSSPVTVDVTGAIATVEIGLEYYRLPAPGYFNITLYGPKGTGVLLDEPIRISFSEPIGKDDFPPFFEISPVIAGLEFNWDAEGRSLMIAHAPFAVNTTYHAKVAGTIVSSAGNWLWGGEDLTWNFTTGMEAGAWSLDTATVHVTSNRTVYVNATGGEGQTVYVIIGTLGSFELEETSTGVYKVVIAGTILAWDKEYSYRFSDTPQGSDMAPGLSGTFKTPKEPGVPIGGDDDDDDNDLMKVLAPCCVVGTILLLIMVIIIVLIMVIKKKGKKSEGEE